MPTLLKYKVLGRVWLALIESHIESHARPWLGRVGTLIDSLTKIAHGEEDESLQNEIEILGGRWREWRLSIQKEKPSSNKSHLLPALSSGFTYALMSVLVASIPLCSINIQMLPGHLSCIVFLPCG